MKRLYKDADKICKDLIKIEKTEKTFIDLFHELTKDYTSSDRIELLTIIPKILAEYGYDLETIPFKLRKY